MANITKVLIRALAPFVLIALSLGIFAGVIDGATLLMGLASLQQQYEQTAAPLTGIIYSSVMSAGSYYQAGTIDYQRSDVDQGSIWALVAVGAIDFICGLLIFFDAVFNRPYAGKPAHSASYKMSIYALVSSVMVMTIFAFAYSFAATYVSRGHVFFSDINVTFAGTTMESINFNTTGYVNQEWYTCYAAGYRNPGGATVAHGTERFSAMTTACQRFMAGRWLTIPLLFVSVWLIVSETWALGWKFGAAPKTSDTSSDEVAKEKENGNTSSDSAPQV